MLRLYGNPGWGSVLVEAQLAWYGLDYENVEAGDVFASPSARDELAKLNPLAQVPVLVLPDGSVMTESAAITLHLADITGSDDLVPSASEAERAAFLRWLVFLVTNIYPTFTFADEPSRFIAMPEAREAYRAAVDAHAQRLWRIVEDHAACTLVPGRTLFGTRHLCLRHDSLAAAAPVVCRQYAEACRDRARWR